MIKVAICGNIASGKSTVQNFLLEKGYKVLDTDTVSHKRLTVKNKELYDVFKNYEVFEDGEFSRYKMGQLIFDNEEARFKIASIMHPQIAREIEQFFEQYKNEPFLFVGIPLLFEAKMENLFDIIVFVYTSDEIRLQRLLERNNYTLEHAKARMNSQMSQDVKVKKADFVLNNDSDLANLKKSVEDFLSVIDD